jgi:hypothetical protein
VETAPYKASHARRSIGSVEGYLALAIIVLGFLEPSVDHRSNDRVIVGAVCIGIAFGLAVGGVRFGEGGGRLAAGVALGILTFWLLVILVVSIVNWERVLWYWRN